MKAEASLEQLAARIAGDRLFADDPVLAVAQRHFVETVGVALSGVRERVVQGTLATMSSVEQGARSLVSPRRMSSRDAAVCNGTAGHAHDYDDDEPHVIVGHPSVVVVAALLGLADIEALTFERALQAYVVGVETMSKLGALVNPRHYNAGWHCTSTLGVFGAVAACSVALDLSHSQTQTALGIAATLSGGLKENFGSDLKPLQVGIAAGNGVWACELAKTSVGGSETALFGERGFVRLLGLSNDANPSFDDFGSPWAVDKPGINVKVYPCCSSTHTALDAMLALRSAHGLVPDDVERVDVWVGEDVPGILIHDIPASGLEGKFSMRYCLAVALAKGEVALESFTDEAVHEPSMLALLRRIRVDTDSTLPRIATGVTHQARVRVSTRRGDQLQREEAVPIGSPELPCSSAQLAAKLRSCVSFGLGSERARRACNAIETLKRSDPLSRILDAVHPDGL